MFYLSAGAVTLSPWIAAAVVLLLAALMLLAVFRIGLGGMVADLIPIGLVFVAIYIGWSLLDRHDRAEATHVDAGTVGPQDNAAVRDHADEKYALDQRMLCLTAQATAPGSALGCLDAALGETIESACEGMLFAGPETVAAALAFVSAELALLADAIDYANRVDSGYLTAVAGLRRSIETDRFGFVAQALGTSVGCTVGSCPSLTMLADAARVETNIEHKTFKGLATKYAVRWLQPPQPISIEGSEPRQPTSEPTPAMAIPVSAAPLPKMRPAPRPHPQLAVSARPTPRAAP